MRFAMPKSSSFVPEAISMMLAGFKIAMDDAEPMCHLERAGDFDAECEYLCEWQWPAVYPCRQRPLLSVYPGRRAKLCQAGGRSRSRASFRFSSSTSLSSVRGR